MLVPRSPGCPEAMAINVLHNRQQLFQPIFEPRAGQDDGIGAFNSLQCTGLLSDILILHHPDL
jgi:hypothetical protein